MSVAYDVIAPGKVHVFAFDVLEKGHFYDKLVLLSLCISMIVLIFRIVGLIEVEHFITGGCFALVSLCKLFDSILLLIQEHSLVVTFLRMVG